MDRMTQRQIKTNKDRQRHLSLSNLQSETKKEIQKHLQTQKGKTDGKNSKRTGRDT